jgi:tryptophan synthase beta chain
MCAIKEALKADEEGTSKTILFNLSGHGYFDMSAYDAYFSGKLVEHHLTEEELYSDLRKLETPVIE